MTKIQGTFNKYLDIMPHGKAGGGDAVAAAILTYLEMGKGVSD